MAANDDINETASGRFYDNEIIYVLWHLSVEKSSNTAYGGSIMKLRCQEYNVVSNIIYNRWLMKLLILGSQTMVQWKLIFSRKSESHKPPRNKICQQV